MSFLQGFCGEARAARKAAAAAESEAKEAAEAEAWEAEFVSRQKRLKKN